MGPRDRETDRGAGKGGLLALSEQRKGTWHISFVLYLLEQASFRELYLAGGVAPGRIMDFGKARRMVINRMMHAGAGPESR